MKQRTLFIIHSNVKGKNILSLHSHLAAAHLHVPFLTTLPEPRAILRAACNKLECYLNLVYRGKTTKVNLI